MELIRELVPAATRVAVLVNPASAASTDTQFRRGQYFADQVGTEPNFKLTWGAYAGLWNLSIVFQRTAMPIPYTVDAEALRSVGKQAMKAVGRAFMLSAMLTISSSLDPPPANAQSSVAPGDSGPRFRSDGPNAEAYGLGDQYPTCKGRSYIQDIRCRVGAFSHFDTLFPARTIAASNEPSSLGRAAQEPVIRYAFAGEDRTLEQYLDRRPITGFLIAKGDTILVERYQYGRSDAQRLASFSLAKTIVGLLIGVAIDEGAIRSIDDVAEAYVSGLTGTEYGRTPIKALLQMRSGVFFREDYGDTTSDIFTLARLTVEQDPAGSLAAVKLFNRRRAAPGALFSYSSADTVVLGLVLAAATRRTVSEYASEKLWRAVVADASWIIDAQGQEITFAYVNAVLRDWARLGLMLANNGSRSGRSVVPRDWLMASSANAIETDSALLKYGYHVWLSADRKRFFLQGRYGQAVLADPDTKLVLVQTALSSDDFMTLELATLWSAARSQLR
jgi:CubicO group peptidase (beta-lactamase class C family)